MKGRDLPTVLLAEGGRWRPERPTLMLVAHQHGNEPGPGEAMLLLLERFLAMGLPLWTGGVLPPPWIELLLKRGAIFERGEARYLCG